VNASGLTLRRTSLAELRDTWGGELRTQTQLRVESPLRFVSEVRPADEWERAPISAEVLLVVHDASAVALAAEAARAGVTVLVDAALASALPEAHWTHSHARWVLAKILATLGKAPEPPVLGTDVRLGPGVVLHDGVRLGDRVRIGANSVIGGPGFGFVLGPDGRPFPIPHMAGVVVASDVQIGALCTIDAGALRPTRIGSHVFLDSQVHVGHHGTIDEGAVICAQTGLAGSVHIGAGAVLGGQVGVADHVSIGAGAKIAAKSGVIGSVPAGEVWGGYPAQPRVRWLRGLAHVYRALSRPSGASRGAEAGS
jgi:acetyltransferase-like isoleucine patch superfamily enzyme